MPLRTRLTRPPGASSERPAAAADLFHITPGDSTPAYVQIQRYVRIAIADGLLKPGDRLPSVRALATRLGLSSHTVARAYALLGREGVTVSRAGAGSEVAPRDVLDASSLARTRRERLRTMARQTAVRGLALGFEPDEIAEAIAAELARHGRPLGVHRALAPLGAEEAALLSARNRLCGTITALRAGEFLAELTLGLSDGTALIATVTRASVDRLGLRVGGPACVYIKATELVVAR